MYYTTDYLRGNIWMFYAIVMVCSFGQISQQVNTPVNSIYKRTVVAPGIELRILPLGDSITYGYLSSDGNGYRLELQNDLTGSDLQYIGSVRSGNMTDNFNEGWPGYTINQIAGKANLSLPERPNIVLLHAGTNDLNEDPPPEPYASAPTRLGALVDQIIDACPDAAVLVAQIINAANSSTESRILTFNAQIPDLVAERVDAGHHVIAVNFSSITTSLLQDGLHPTDAGYSMMGDIWFDAIQEAAAKGWINKPVGPDPSSDRLEKKEQECLNGLFWYPIPGGGQISGGVGYGGGATSVSNSQPHWTNTSGLGLDGSGIRFADIDGDGLDDYLWINATNGAVTAYFNRIGKGATNWVPVNGGHPINKDMGSASHIFFADLNGDGKADYLNVDPVSGAVTYYENAGANPIAPNGWHWIKRGPIASGLGEVAGVRFADIDGDGRDDYIWLSESGAATVYINKIGDLAANWIPLNNGQPITNGVGACREDVRFADINGDGKVDYLWVHPTDGSVDLWTNEIGRNPAHLVQSTGKVATGVGYPGSCISFGVLTNSGRADYIPVDPSTGQISPWLNGCSDPTVASGDDGGS